MYKDPTYNIHISKSLVGHPNVPVALGTASGAGAGTSTHSGTTTGSVNGAFVFQKMFRPAAISGLRVFVGTAPGGGVTALNMVFLNGTNTVATCLVGTHTAGEWLDATLTAATQGSNGAQTGGTLLQGASPQLTMVTTYTQTATASTLGNYSIEVEYSDLFTT